MVEKPDNPIDDDLLRELGLEPREPTPPQKPKPVPRPAAKPAVPVSPAARSAAKTSHVPPMEEEELQPAQPESPERFEQGAKGLAQNLPIQVVAVLGKKTMTLKDVCSIKQGELFELNKLPQESVDLVANGKLIARGDLVMIDGKLGIQIKQLVG